MTGAKIAEGIEVAVVQGPGCAATQHLVAAVVDQTLRLQGHIGDKEGEERQKETEGKGRGIGTAVKHGGWQRHSSRCRQP